VSRIVLYAPRGLSLTEKVGRALRVKGLAFELVAPHSPDDYRRFSPETGLLPVLELDGERVPDSVRILDHLDERFPEPPLVSADPRAAREQRRLERWMDESFAFYMLRWIQSRLGAGAVPPAPSGGFPLSPLAGLGLIEHGKLQSEVFDARSGGPGAEFERRLQDLDQMLGTRSWFYADRLSRADLSVCGSLALLHRDVYAGARALLEARPRLLAHLERVFAATGGAEPI
jgi:glutathione S-transferase